MSHVSGHVERDLPIEFNLNIVEKGTGEGEGGEERSRRNDEYDDEETENASDNKDYICQWRGCNHQSPSSSEIVRHVHFHSFHTKLKSHGRNVVKARRFIDFATFETSKDRASVNSRMYTFYQTSYRVQKV